jgi:hypothetical protein
MNRNIWAWTIFILLLNIFAVGYLRHSVISDNSDKSIILFWFYYPLIIIGNGIAWYILRKTDLNKPLQKVIIALLILFLPLLFTMD